MKYFFLLLSITMAGVSLSAQTRVPVMMETSLDKIKSSSQSGRVIERTVADIIFRDDSIHNNCNFRHRLSSSNSYRINAFSPSSEASSIYIYILYLDDKGEWQTAASNTTGGTSDVSLRFSPSVTRDYTIAIRGTLKTGINNSLFNLIIERE